MPIEIKQWISLVILIVAAVFVCLLSASAPDRVDPPIEKICPYPTETRSCPYQLGS
jgi:hypothetical protein